MRTLFSQEAVWEIEMHNARREARDEGLQEGRQEGRQEEFAKSVHSMRKAGLDDSKIAALLEKELVVIQAVK